MLRFRFSFGLQNVISGALVSSLGVGGFSETRCGLQMYFVGGGGVLASVGSKLGKAQRAYKQGGLGS